MHSYSIILSNFLLKNYNIFNVIYEANLTCNGKRKSHCFSKETSAQGPFLVL